LIKKIGDGAQNAAWNSIKWSATSHQDTGQDDQSSSGVIFLLRSPCFRFGSVATLDVNG